MAKMKYIELAPSYDVPLIEVPEDYTKEQINAHLKGASVHKQLQDAGYLYAFGLDPVKMDKPEDMDDWDITRGAKAGYDSLMALWSGASAAFYDVFGMEEQQQEAIQQLQQYQLEAAVHSFETDDEGNRVKAATTVEEILNSEDKLDSFLDWLGYNIGQGAVTTTPIILAGLMTGGVGAVAAGTAGRAAAGGFIGAATKGIGTGMITSRINPVGIGVAFAAQQMGLGDIYGEQTEKSKDPNAAIAYGLSIPYAAAESIFGAGSFLLGRLVNKAGKEAVVKSFKDVGKAFVKHTGRAAAGEAVAEGTQEAIVQSGGALEEGKDLMDLYGSKSFWKRVGEGAAAGAAGGSPFGMVAGAGTTYTFLKTKQAKPYIVNGYGKEVPLITDDKDDDIAGQKFNIGDEVSVTGGHIIDPNNDTNVDMYGNPIEDKHGNRVNPKFTMLGMIYDEGKKFFVLQNKTRGAKKSVLTIPVNEASNIFTKQETATASKTNYQYSKDKDDAELSIRYHPKTVKAARKKLKLMGYTDKDITEGADRQSEDEFVMEKYNSIIEARLDQKRQQDQLNDQAANPDKYDEFDRIEEVDLLANDLQDYDALEEDALRQALREDYQRERDIDVVEFSGGKKNILGEDREKALSALNYMDGPRGLDFINTQLERTELTSDGKTTKGLRELDKVIKKDKPLSAIIETIEEKVTTEVGPMQGPTLTNVQKSFRRLKLLAKKLNSVGSIWLTENQTDVLREKIYELNQESNKLSRRAQKLKREIADLRKNTEHTWAAYSHQTVIVNYVNSEKTMQIAQARIDVLNRAKDKNAIILEYSQIVDPKTGIVQREARSYTVAQEIAFYQKIINETREMRREFIQLSIELGEQPISSWATFRPNNAIIGRIQKRLYGGTETTTQKVEKKYFSVKDGQAELTDDMENNIPLVKQALINALDKMNLSWVNLQFFNRYFDEKTGTQLNGEFLIHNKTINVALNASVENINKEQSRMFVLFHEAMHALFEQGLFTKQEEQKLRQASRKYFIKKYKIRERYKGFNLTEAQIEEEGISEAFAQHAINAQVEVGVIKTLFNRLLGYLLALREALFSSGFDTIDKIFDASQIGLVGNRYAGKAANERNRTTIYNTSITPVGITTNDSPLFSVAFNQNINQVNEIYGTTFGGETSPDTVKTNRNQNNGTGRKLEREIDAAKKANPNLIKDTDINSFSRIMNYASEWAQSIPLFGFMFRSIQAMDQKARDIQAEFVTLMDLYIKVAKDPKAKALLDKAHMISQEPILVNGKLVKNNTHYRMDQTGRITFVASRDRKSGGANPVEIKEGEVIILEGDTAQAYEDSQVAINYVVTESMRGVIASTFTDNIRDAISLLQSEQAQSILRISGLPDLNTMTDDQIENITFSDVTYIVRSLQAILEYPTKANLTTQLKSDIEALLGNDGELKTNLFALQEELGKINRWQQSDYVPFQRHGNYYVTVRQAPNEEQLKADPKAKGALIHYEHIEADINPLSRETQFNQVRQRLQEEYAGENVTISDIKKIDLKAMQNTVGSDFTAIDSMSQYLSEANQQKYKDARQEMKSVLGSYSKEQITGFDAFVTGRQKVGGVNGFDGDFVRGILNFGLMGSEYAARNRFMTEITSRRELFNQNYDEGTNIRKGVDKWYTYKVDDPTQEWSQLRRAGFWWFLGGNVSSALLQTMSLVQFTGPMLGSFAGNLKAAKALSVGFKDAMKMITFRKNQYGDLFLNFNLVPSDIREEVMEAVRKGIIKQGQLLQEIGMPVGHPTSASSAEGTAKRKIHDFEMTVVGGAFNTMETVSRMAAYIAALRLARDPTVLAKANEYFQGNGLWEAMRFERAGGALTPQMLAEFITDRTFGLYGKLNRNNIARGFGSVAFLFTTYIGQMFALMYRSFTSGETEAQKRVGRRMFTKMILAIGITGGYMAIPAVDDAEDFFSWVMSQVTGVKRDYSDQFKDMIESAIGERGAEAMQNGIFNAYGGMDIQRRIGFGQLPGSQQFKALMSLTGLSTGADAKDIGGAPMAMVFGTLEKVFDELKKDGMTSLVPYVGRDSDALAALFPTAIQNMYKAQKYALQGYADTNRGTLLTHDLGAMDIAMQAVGFAPSKIANKRAKLYREQQTGGATSEYRKRMNGRITQAIQDIIIAQTITNDSSAADEAQERLLKLMRDVMLFNQSHDYIHQYLPDITRLREEALKKINDNYRVSKADKKKRAALTEILN